MEQNERIAQLEAQLAGAQLEIRNSHALLALLAHRQPGGVILTDEEMGQYVGQLVIFRDERIPGCVILVKPEQPPQTPN